MFNGYSILVFVKSCEKVYFFVSLQQRKRALMVYNPIEKVVLVRASQWKLVEVGLSRHSVLSFLTMDRIAGGVALAVLRGCFTYYFTRTRFI